MHTHTQPPQTPLLAVHKQRQCWLTRRRSRFFAYGVSPREQISLRRMPKDQTSPSIVYVEWRRPVARAGMPLLRCHRFVHPSHGPPSSLNRVLWRSQQSSMACTKQARNAAGQCCRVPSPVPASHLLHVSPPLTTSSVQAVHELPPEHPYKRGARNPVHGRCMRSAGSAVGRRLTLHTRPLPRRRVALFVPAEPTGPTTRV